MNAPRAALAVLRSLPLLHGVSEPFLNSLVHRSHVVFWRAGEPIHLEGAEAIPLTVVVKGCVRLERTIAGGQSAVLGILGAGQVVDESAFVTQSPTLSRAICLEETQGRQVAREDFEAVMKRHPEACPVILREACRRLAAASDRVDSLLGLDASGRLSREFLHHLPPRFDGQWCEVDLAMSQEELARRIGTRRETANRCLQELRRENVLQELGRGRYRIDVPKLYRVAGYPVISGG